jgi:hypothetical protein
MFLDLCSDRGWKVTSTSSKLFREMGIYHFFNVGPGSDRTRDKKIMLRWNNFATTIRVPEEMT